MHNDKMNMMIAVTANDGQMLQATAGKVLDMAPASVATDSVDYINFYLSKDKPIWDGSATTLLTVINSSVKVVQSTADIAVVEALGTYTETPNVEVRTNYIMKPDQEWVEAISTITNKNAEALTVWIGDILDNDDGNQYSYMPGAGLLAPKSTRQEFAPTDLWFAQYGNAPAVQAVIYDKTFADFIGLGANQTFMSMKQITIPANGTYTHRRFLAAVVSEGAAEKIDPMIALVKKIQSQN
jgi:hypothetical protein